ncbi:MAG: hypothetical protein JRN46_01150 [Nitrososphaerota archaeon]|nr:hypothetical protein [Nitrososphaerota archaeon]
MSAGKLGLRAVLAAVFGAIALVVFYYVPASLGTLASRLVGPADTPAVSSLVASLVGPTLPALGVAVAVLVFVCFFLRGTKAYGPVLVVLGLALLAYVYVLFHGGTVYATVPTLSQYSAAGSVAISMAALMYLFMLPPLLTVVKGAVLTAAKPDVSPAPPG